MWSLAVVKVLLHAASASVDRPTISGITKNRAFKYLGSIVGKDGEIGDYVTQRVVEYELDGLGGKVLQECCATGRYPQI